MEHINTQVNKRRGWSRAPLDFPTSANHDKRLCELEGDFKACSKAQGRDCFGCPCEPECTALWDKASKQSGEVKYLLSEELEDFRKQFAGIQQRMRNEEVIQQRMRNEEVRIAYCPECRMAGLRLYDENGDKCPVKGHHQWCRRCQEWVIPEWRTVLRYGRLK